MTKNEMTRALAIAQNNDISLTEVDHSVLHGMYLQDFKPVRTTIEVAAKLLRELVVRLDGSIDYDELNDFTNCSRRRVTILN